MRLESPPPFFSSLVSLLIVFLSLTLSFIKFLRQHKSIFCFFLWGGMGIEWLQYCVTVLHPLNSRPLHIWCFTWPCCMILFSLLPSYFLNIPTCGQFIPYGIWSMWHYFLSSPTLPPSHYYSIIPLLPRTHTFPTLVPLPRVPSRPLPPTHPIPHRLPRCPPSYLKGPTYLTKASGSISSQVSCRYSKHYG